MYSPLFPPCISTFEPYPSIINEFPPVSVGLLYSLFLIPFTNIEPDVVNEPVIVWFPTNEFEPVVA